jgi:hypothetical protein
MSDTERLQTIKDAIEHFNKQQQIEILKLLIKNTTTISENNNGSFINLTELSITTLIKLEEYIQFVNTQHNQLQCMEQEKDIIKKEFFGYDKSKRKIKTISNINVVING